MNLLDNKYFKIGVISLLLLGIGFGAGRFSKPAKVVTQIQTKEVVKTVEVKQENKNVVITTKKTTEKDGTVVEETKTEDKSVVNSETKSDSLKEAKSETITTRDIGLSVQALTLMKINDFNNREYGVLVKKRIIGNISGTIAATNKGTAIIAVGLDF